MISADIASKTAISAPNIVGIPNGNLTGAPCPYIKNPNRIPAATAEPITPATFGPIACISK